MSSKPESGGKGPSSSVQEWLRRHLQLFLVLGLGTLWLLTLWIAFAVGSHFGGEESATAVETEEGQRWYCAMDPQVPPQEKPGRCPICGMDLVPLPRDGAGDRDTPILEMSPTAVALAEVETTRVERKNVTAEIRMVGKVDFDETRLAYIAAWVPGRLDRLYVDYTGVPVRKGDHLVYIYSPDVRTAQEELLEAVRGVAALENSHVSRETGLANLEAARKKLLLWGLSEEQVEEIEERGTASDHITIFAPIGGIVIHKNALEGMYVETGTRIYTIADLKHIWVKLDAYESDMMWVRYGQEVEFRTEAYPGQVFHGQIAFIDPVLNEQTRTVKVRVNVDNSGLRLKPGMFVRAVVRAEVAGAGLVMDPTLVGKWICPMHPEVIADGPGDCNLCGMDLVEAAELGYEAPADHEPPLVIPTSAPLITGKRAVVYVKLPDPEAALFEGREIVLGPRTRDYYLVESGLEEGEEIVVRGAFKIDSAIQIEAKPSMMSSRGSAPPPGHHHGGEQPKPPGKVEEAEGEPASPHPVSAEMQGQLAALLEGYLSYHAALFASDGAAAAEAAKDLLAALKAAAGEHIHGEAGEAWQEVSKRLHSAIDPVVSADDLGGQRAGMPALTDALIGMLARFDWSEKPTVYRMHCPMALGPGKGADWLQREEEVRNPFLGDGTPMQRCGRVEERLEGGGEE